MARRPRIDFPSALQHVMNRVIARASIFHDDAVCRLFLAVLAELPERFGVLIHGYALMPNHYHLLLESVEGNLSDAMRFLGATFTQRYNRLHGRDGPLFRGRFCSKLVRTDAHWMHLLAYLHLNPVRAGLAPTAEAARWTSHAAYLSPSERPDWLTCDAMIQQFGSLQTVIDYIDDVQEGRPGPDGFDPERLWARTTLDTPPPPRPLRSVSEALDDVAAVLQIPVDQLVKRRLPHQPHPTSAWIAAWWLGRSAGLSQQAVADLFGMPRTTVGRLVQRLRRLARSQADLRRCMTELHQSGPWRARTADVVPDAA